MMFSHPAARDIPDPAERCARSSPTRRSSRILSLAAMVPMVGRQDRSHSRLRHRALAHPGHQPAGEFRRALAGRGAGRGRCCGAVVGLLNGILVEVARIDSFIATLGTGTMLYAIALWHTGGSRWWACCRKGSWRSTATMIFGLPITGFYVLGIRLRAVARARASAHRPLPLCDRRKSEIRGAQRHSCAALHYGGVPRLGRL